MRFSDYIKSVMREDRNPLGAIINDKIRVKEYCEERLSPETVKELFTHRIYSGYSVDECMAAIKPPCVVRLNNGWHKMKFLLSPQDAIDPATLREWQATKWTSCEWSYQQIKSGFTVETLLPKVHNLFKIFIFHGKVKLVWGQRYDVSAGKIGLVGATLHTTDWERIPAPWNKAHMIEFEKPKRLNEMISIAEKLYSPDWKFMRIDLYNLPSKRAGKEGEEIRFSEMMQYHAGGTNGFHDFDYVLGLLI